MDLAIEAAEIEFIVLVHAEGGDLKIGLHEPGIDRIVHVTVVERPDPFAAVVRVNVFARQSGQSRSSINEATRNGYAGAPAVLPDRHFQPRRTANFSRGVAMFGLHVVPTIVSTIFNNVNLFERILAHITCPEAAIGRVKTETPWVSHAVR